MKRNFLTLAILAVSLVFVLISCKKVEDPEKYLRGGNSLALTDDGNLIIAGYNSSASYGFDATLVKASASNGDTIWSKSYGGSYSDAFYSVDKANKGGYIATGFTNQSFASSPRLLVVITDSKGTLVKSKTFGGSNLAQGFSILPHFNSDSGYLVAGYMLKSGRTDRDIYLVRLKNDGEPLWEKTYGSRTKDASDTLNDAAYKIIAAKDGGYFITGSMNGYNSCCGKIFLMKVSSKGDSLWTKTYNTGIGSSLTLTNDGGIAIGGSLQEGSNQDIIIIKTDLSGNLKWKKSYAGAGYEYGSSLVETTDGSLVIAGITDSKGVGSDDVYLLKASSGGDLIWDKTYGGTDIDQGYGLVQMTDGGFCITGLSNSGGSYIYLCRTSADGAQVWFKNIK